MDKTTFYKRHLQGLKQYIKSRYIINQIYALKTKQQYIESNSMSGYKKYPKPIINHVSVTTKTKIYNKEQIIEYLKAWRKNGYEGTITAVAVANLFLGINKYSSRQERKKAYVTAHRILQKLFEQGFFTERITKSPTQYVF